MLWLSCLLAFGVDDVSVTVVVTLFFGLLTDMVRATHDI